MYVSRLSCCRCVSVSICSLPRPVYAAADLYSAMLRTAKSATTTRLQKSYWLVNSTSCKTMTLSSARGSPRLFTSLPVAQTCLTECSFPIHSYTVQCVSSRPWLKVTTKQSWRRRAEQLRLPVRRVGHTPSQNAILLQYLATIDLSSSPDPEELSRTPDPQAVYDSFYASALALLEEFYPERTITVTSRDPSPELHYTGDQSKVTRLRQKNRLMRAGRVDEAASAGPSDRPGHHPSEQASAGENWQQY